MCHKPVIIELVGPPGVGKTTLAEALRQRNNNIRVDIFPYFRRLQHAPFFTRNLISLLPIFFQLQRLGRLTRRDTAIMTILHGWYRDLQQSVTNSNPIIVLEEGAVCLLAKLLISESTALKSKDASKWWTQTYENWANTLNLIIQLNSPTPLLIKRVRARGQFHEIDKLSDAIATDYLARIQTAQQQVLTNLINRAYGPKILRFNTTENTADEICDKIFSDNQCYLYRGTESVQHNIPLRETG